MTMHRFAVQNTGDARATAHVMDERTYADVSVRAFWRNGFLVTLDVIGASTAPDALSHAALFIHDVYLILNLATPGSFGGTFMLTGCEVHFDPITFDPVLFETAAVAPMPLAKVIAWYDAQQIGTTQVADTPVETVLFHLLHVARGTDSEPMALLRLVNAAETLGMTRIDIRATPVVHPLHDDSLDPRADDPAFDLTVPADHAARFVISALRARIA